MKSLFKSGELSLPLSLHCYSSGPHKLTESKTFQHFDLGFGEILVGHIKGCTDARNSGGYPGLSIPEAEAVFNEVVHRWNHHAELTEQLRVACVRLEQAAIKLQHVKGANCEELAGFIIGDLAIARASLIKAEGAS